MYPAKEFLLGVRWDAPFIFLFFNQNSVAVYPEQSEGSHSFSTTILLSRIKLFPVARSSCHATFLIVQFQPQFVFQFFDQWIPFCHLQELLTGSKWCAHGNFLFFVFFHYNKKLEKIILEFFTQKL